MDERPASFVDGYLPYLLGRAYHLISGEFHDELARRGVPVMTWRIVASLWPDRTLGLTELAGIVLLKQPTCSKVIARLEAEGVVRRVADREDRRGVRISLTPKGRKLGEPLVAAAQAHERTVRAPLSADEERVLLAVLRRLIDR